MPNTIHNPTSLVYKHSIVSKQNLEDLDSKKASGNRGFFRIGAFVVDFFRKKV